MQTICVAKALVFDGQDNCLVLTRSKTHPKVPLKPDLPGGQIDGGEAPAQTIAREIAEETGLSFEPSDIRVVFATTTVDDGKNFVRFLGIARTPQVRPDVTISWEHDAAEWIPLDNLLQKLTHPEYTKGVRHILSNHLL